MDVHGIPSLNLLEEFRIRSEEKKFRSISGLKFRVEQGKKNLQRMNSVL